MAMSKVDKAEQTLEEGADEQSVEAVDLEELKRALGGVAESSPTRIAVRDAAASQRVRASQDDNNPWIC
jgi:hypothetical protein